MNRETMSIESVLSGKRNWHVELGDVLDTLRAMPDGCINAVVTSPPYYALRSYLPADHPDKHKEHGSEPSPEAFIATMVAVFEEVRRVLRDDGVVWMNLGDSYAGHNADGFRPGNEGKNRGNSNKNGIGRISGLKPGDKLNMPHRVAEALQAAGWYWRDTVIWHKKSPMPESVSGYKWTRCRRKVGVGMDSGEASKQQTDGRPHSARGDDGSSFDRGTIWVPCEGCPKCLPNNGLVLRRGRWRCTQAHEYVFMFAKSDEYFCDGEAGKEKASADTKPQGNSAKAKSATANVGEVRANVGLKPEHQYAVEFANPRNVWSLSHEPTKEKHFAAYPTELVRKCLLPSLANAYCEQCGAPHAPVVEEERKATRPALTNKIWKHENGDHVGQRSDDSPNLDPERHIKCSTVTGYKATCGCNAGTTTALVMDPYCGTGTTGEVALKMGARFLGFELNPEYKAMADRRVMKKLPLFVS